MSRFTDESGMFPDFNFKLVVINSLLGLHPSFEAEWRELKRRYVDPADPFVFRAFLKNTEKSSADRESHGRVVVLDGRQPACVLRLALQSPSSLPFFSLFPRTALGKSPFRK